MIELKEEMETFGEWVRHRRSELKFTRAQLAERVGCSVALLRKIEDGERRPSAQIAELMANCLNILPEQHSTFVRVARGELSVDRLSTTLKPVASSKISRIDLPVLPTPLVGRQREVEELSQLLRDPQCRLLTLVGPGGIGKTRLAIETASRVQDVFADGVYFVPLASIGSINAVISMIADAIHFAFYGPSDPTVQLLNHLQDKHLLLLLDNLEHLLVEESQQETLVELLLEILRQAVHVKLVTTSREALGLQDEWVVEVAGLPIPARTDTEGGTQNTSVELFLQRARRAHVGFFATQEDFPAIVRICQLVDGMPLGIELAAAWVRTLSCDEIAEELERGLGFLSVSARDVPARHRSMQAVFDQSWKLLSEQEQTALLRLSVFRGGFRREVAEQVANATLQVLSTLVTKSLIRRSNAGRYDLHELVRQFALAKLADDAEQMHIAQEQHSLYYLRLLREQGLRLQTRHQKEAVADLTGDMDNIRSAWDWSIATHEFIRLYQVSARLMHLCEVRNWFQEGDTTFRKTANAMQASGQRADLELVQRVALHAMLAHWGYFQLRLGKAQEAYNILLPSAAFLRASAEPIPASYSLFYLGIDCWILGKFSEAKKSLQASRILASECGEYWFEAMASEFLGGVSTEQGEYNQARQYLSEALTMLRRLGDPSMTAHTLSYVGRTMQSLGEYREADKLLHESLELSRENGYRFATGLALDGLGELAYIEGRYKDALPLFSESASLFQELGDTHRLSRTLYHRGLNFLALDQVVEAEHDFNSALRLAYKGGFTSAALNAMLGIALLGARQNASQGRLELVLYVLEHPASTQETKTRADRLRAELEAQLTRPQVEASQAWLQSKTFDAVVSEILGQIVCA